MQEASDHPLGRSLVCIRSNVGGEPGEIVGAGFLSAEGLVCTCAHVVADALGDPEACYADFPPEGVVHIEFPFHHRMAVQAVPSSACSVWMPIRPDDGGGDIAVLQLTDRLPPDIRPARLLPARNLAGRRFSAFGFPKDADEGRFAYGILRDRLPNGWVQLEDTKAQGIRVQKGFSGAPVWVTEGRGIVGMIVANDTDAETKVAFLIPNDVISQACPKIQPIDIRRPYAALTEGLAGLPGGALNGVEQFLREYLGTPHEPAPFGGRQEQLAELDRWLADSDQPYALLAAEAGRGKSALLSQWASEVADEGRATVVFVPVSIRFGTALRTTALGLLGGRLRHLHNVTAEPPREPEVWLTEIDGYLREDHATSRPLLVVLDGVDEAADWECGRDLRFPIQPGDGVKVLVSARLLAGRDAVGWLRHLEWEGLGVPLGLPRLDRRGVGEVLESMGNPLADLAGRVDVVSELLRLSEGDPLLVRLYVEALKGRGDQLDAFLRPEDLRRLEPGLKAYFDRWWEDQRRRWGASTPLAEPAVRALLNVLACALGPLSTEDVLALTSQEGLDTWTLEETALPPMARFVIGDGKRQGYVFSHPRLGQYFRDRLSAAERRAWEGRFLNYGSQVLGELNAGRVAPQEAPAHVVQYYGAYLEQAEADPQRFYALISEGWLRTWEALTGTYDGFLNDLRRAWKRAKAAGRDARTEEERSQVVGLQVRYALIATSINSRVGNIPPELLAALVEQKVWTQEAGLAYVRLKNGQNRADALISLAPALNGQTVLAEALEVAGSIDESYDRARALAAIVPRLSEDERPAVLAEALEVARSIDESYDRARALAAIVPRLSEDVRPAVWGEALEVARSIDKSSLRAEALAAIAARLAEAGRVVEALGAARSIEDSSLRAGALAAIAPRLAEDERPAVLAEALEAARSIDKPYDRAQTLARIYLSLPWGSHSTAYTLWCDAMDYAASDDRRTLLTDIADLAPTIEALGGTAALTKTADAIREVGLWFP